MNHFAFVLSVAGFAASTVGCASRPAQIELTSSDFDLAPLVGEWRGNYNSAETGRSGTIAFTLRAGEAAASGNVVMTPGADSSKLGADSSEVAHRPIGSDIVRDFHLKIRFVRKEGGNVVGTLDPYRAPDCNCVVTTTFQGSFRDARTIEGTFTTVPSVPGSKVTGGKWTVTRVKRL